MAVRLECTFGTRFDMVPFSELVQRRHVIASKELGIQEKENRFGCRIRGLSSAKGEADEHSLIRVEYVAVNAENGTR